MKFMKTIFIISILILSVTTINGQAFLPKIESIDARDCYSLKGNPHTLYHQTFELLRDSLTGEIVIGDELDYFSDLSYRINFTDQGNVYGFHYIQNGISCTSIHNFFDKEERYCNLQIMDNVPVSYQRSWVDNYKEPHDNQVHVYKLIQEDYSIPGFCDSLLLTRCDTTFCIEKDSIILSVYMPDTDIQSISLPVKDSLYYIHIIDSCLNNRLPKNRTINLYNEQEQLVKIIKYTEISPLPTSIETFYYNKQGMLISDTTLSHLGFGEFGEVIYVDNPQVDIFLYEYPDNSIDGHGNWIKRYVFRQYQHERAEPLYMEHRRITYTD